MTTLAPVDYGVLLRTLCQQTHWPEAFQDDVALDIAWLQRIRPAHFAWGVRATGTRLWLVDSTASLQTLHYTRQHPDQRHRFFLASGECRLTECPGPEQVWDYLLRHSRSSRLRVFARLADHDERAFYDMQHAQYIQTRIDDELAKENVCPHPRSPRRYP